MRTSQASISRDTKEKVRRLARGAKAGFVTMRRARELLGLPPNAAGLALGRLIAAGWLARVRRGLYLVLPLEADRAGGVIEDPWILARELYGPCYVGGWTAAEHWGLTEQIFRPTFVVSGAMVRRSSSTFLGAEFRVVRVRRGRIDTVPAIWRGRERMAVSDRARTIADGLASPSWVGGIRHLSQMLLTFRKQPEWSIPRLLAAVEETGSGAALKRLGFLSEAILPDGGDIASHALAGRTKGVVRLDPGVLERGHMNTRWRLWINVALDRKWPEE